MISDTGHIIEFSYLQSRFSFNGLPNMKKLPTRADQNIYAYENKGSVYFLSTSMDRNVVRYDLHENLHYEISRSKIPNAHLPDSELNYAFWDWHHIRSFGVRIGDFFWIILGGLTGKYRLLSHIWRIAKVNPFNSPMPHLYIFIKFFVK